MHRSLHEKASENDTLSLSPYLPVAKVLTSNYNAFLHTHMELLKDFLLRHTVSHICSLLSQTLEVMTKTTQKEPYKCVELIQFCFPFQVWFSTISEILAS